MKLIQKRELHFFNLITITSAGLAVVIALLGILGIILNITQLSSLLPLFKPISFSAALLWMILGIILVIHTLTPIKGIFRLMTGIILILLCLAAIFELLFTIYGGHCPIETGFVTMIRNLSGQSVSFISPISAFLIIPSVLGILVIFYRSELSEYSIKIPTVPRSGPQTRQMKKIFSWKISASAGLLGLTIDIVSFTYLLSYLLGCPFFYGTWFVPISVPSVIASLLIGISLISASGPKTWPVCILSGSSVRARLLRTFLPLTCFIILLLSFCEIWFSSFYNSQNIIIVASFLTVFILLSWFTIVRVSSQISRQIEEAEDKVRDALDILKLTHRAAKSGSWDWDFITSELKWSEEFFELFGLDPGFKPSFDTWLNALHPGDRKPALDTIHRSVQDRIPLYNEYRIILPGGEIRWIAAWGNNTYNAVDEPVRMSGICIDITIQKHANEVVQESEERYRTLFRTMVQGVVYQDESGRIINANPAAEKILGLTLDEMKGRTSDDPIWKSIREDCNGDEGNAHPAMTALQTGKETRGIIGIFNPAEEQYRWIQVHAIPQFYGSDPKPIQVVTTFDDITYLKLAEKSLSEKNQYLESLITNANVPIIIWDSSFMITRINHACELLIDKGIQEVIHMPLSILFPHDQAELTMRLIQTTLEGVRWETVELPLQRKDGSTRMVVWNSSTIYSPDGGVPIATLAQGRDVTAERVLEEEKKQTIIQIQKNIAQLALLNDGIRNPLAVIDCFAEMTGDHTLADGIHAEVMHIDEMINTLDREWVNSEKILSYLIKHHNFSRDLDRTSPDYRDITGYHDPSPLNSPSRDPDIRKMLVEEIQAQLYTILDSIDAVIYVSDLDSYDILYINRYGRNLCGNVIGQKCYHYLQKGMDGPCPFCTNHLLIDKHGPTGVYKWEFVNTLTGKWFECRDRAIKWTDGRHVRFEIATDITDKKLFDEVLGRNRRILQEIIDNTNTRLVYLDTGFTIIAVNKAYARTCNMSPDDMVGQNFFTLHPYQEDEPVFRNVLESGESLFFHDKQFIFTDWPEPKTTYWDWRLAPVKDDDMKVTALVLSLVETTERKLAEVALQKSERKYRTIFETTGTATVLVENDGTIILANAEFERMSGYSKEEIEKKKKWMDFVLIEDLDRMMIQHRLRRQDPDKALPHYDFRFRSQSGKIRDIYLTIDIIPGTFISVASLLDITDRKKTETALRESEYRLKEIIEQLPDATFVIDNEGRVTAWNQAMEELTGISKEKMVGRGNYEYALPFYNERRPILIDYALSYQEEISKKYPVFSRTGSQLYAEGYVKYLNQGKGGYFAGTASLLVRTDGIVSGAIESVRDITEWKRTEEELKQEHEDLERSFEELTETQEELRQSYLDLAQSQQELARNEALLQRTGEIAKIGGWELDPVSLSITWTDEMYRIHDLPIQNPPSLEDAISFYHPDEREKITSAIQHALAGGEGYDMELRFFTATGRKLWIRTVCLPLVKDGLTVRLTGTLQDITDRKHAEEALSESEKKYREIFDNAIVGFFQTTPEGRLINANRAFAQMYGYKSPEDILTAITDIGTQIYADQEDRRSVVRELSDTGYLQPRECRVRKKDGEIFWILQSARLVTWAEGSFRFFEGTNIDITERKQTEENLRKEKLFSENLLKTAPVIILVLDKEGKIIHFNPYMEDISGYPLGEVRGKDWFRTFLPDCEYDRVRSLFRNAVFDISTEGNVNPIITKDGREILVEWYDITLKDENNNTIGLLAVGQDITERRAAEETLSQSNRKLRLLTSLTRHDILNHLDVIEAFHYLALTSDDPAAAREYISRATEAGKRIEAVISFTREYENFGVATSGWQNVVQVIESAIKEVNPATISIAIQISRSLEIYADPIIRKVFSTLLDNSVRHGMMVSSVRFSVWKSEDDLVIRCVDDGIGISSERKEIIFEHGYGEHTGIGLFLAREILSITGITIRENGVPGNGARFEILVPRGKWRGYNGSE